MADLLFRDPRFDALRNALYHTERQNFFDRLNRSLNFLVIVLSAGVVGKIAGHIHLDAEWLELSVVFFATAQLVFDLGSRARDHEFLQRRYYELLAEMETDNSNDSYTAKKWSAKLLTISSEEPMTMRALDAVAYNKALDAVYDDPDLRKKYRQRVRWWQFLLRNWCPFQATNFQNP